MQRTVADIIAERTAQTPEALDKKRQEERHTEQTQHLSSIERSIYEAFSGLVRYLDGKVTKTEVVNHLTNIGTPDALKVIPVLESLHETLKTHKNTDLSEITNVMKLVLEEARKIPKDKVQIPEVKLNDYSKQFKSLEGAVSSVEKALKAKKLVAPQPIVNVPEANIHVPAPNLNPLLQADKEIVEAIKGIAIPEFKQDYSSLEKLLLRLDKSIKALPDQMPISSGGGMGGIASFANSQGTITQVVLNSDGSVPTNTSQPSTSSVTSVASSASNVTLLTSNTSRKQATVYNDSTQVLYLKLGATASSSSYTVQIAAGGYYELPQPVYTGKIDGIWASANGNARITELS